MRPVERAAYSRLEKGALAADGANSRSEDQERSLQVRNRNLHAIFLRFCSDVFETFEQIRAQKPQPKPENSQSWECSAD